MTSSDAQIAHESNLHSGPDQTHHAILEPSAPSTAQKTRQQTFASTVKRHLFEHVRPSLFAEVELLILTFCTGIQDAISFPEYHCFASNQTGNTVLLSLALIPPSLDSDTFSTVNTAISLALFLVGAYTTGQLSHLVGPRQRLWLILCNALQTLLVIIAAALQLQLQLGHHGDGAPPTTSTTSVYSLALLAFASGSQVVQSRSLRMTEISTAMATAAWVDLLIDPRLMVVRGRRGGQGNRPRNRRLAFLFALVAGSLVGAGIFKTIGSAVAIFMSAGGKAVVTIMFFFNGAEKEKDREAV